MLMKEAMAIIRKAEKKKEKEIEQAREKAKKKKSTGFIVHFEVIGGGVRSANYFPDKHAGEKLIKTEEEAWEFAERFAKSTPSNYVNLYVVNGDNFVPVAGYREKTIGRC